MKAEALHIPEKAVRNIYKVSDWIKSSDFLVPFVFFTIGSYVGVFLLQLLFGLFIKQAWEWWWIFQLAGISAGITTAVVLLDKGVYGKSVKEDEIAVLKRFGNPKPIFIWPGNYRVSPFHGFIIIPWIYEPLAVKSSPITKEGTLIELSFLVEIEPHDPLKLIQWSKRSETKIGESVLKLHSRITQVIDAVALDVSNDFATQQLWSPGTQNGQEKNKPKRTRDEREIIVTVKDYPVKPGEPLVEQENTASKLQKRKSEELDELFSKVFVKKLGKHPRLKKLRGSNTFLFEDIGCVIMVDLIRLDAQQEKDREVLAAPFREKLRAQGEQEAAKVRSESIKKVVSRLEDELPSFAELPPKDKMHVATLILDFYKTEELKTLRLEGEEEILKLAGGIVKKLFGEK